jgi:Fur family ferric uptake transcriptional regulator
MPHCMTLIERLRQRGYRVTPQREMIIEAVAHNGHHVSAEEVFEAVRQRTHAINLATVYRTLDLLVEEGLASRADLGGGRVVYATLRHGPHIHLVCRQCGKVIETEADVLVPLIQALQAQWGFSCDAQHLAITGLCADCQKQLAASPELRR